MQHLLPPPLFHPVARVEEDSEDLFDTFRVAVPCHAMSDENNFISTSKATFAQLGHTSG